MCEMFDFLPDEALVCIFEYVDGRQLISRVSLVCRRFRYIISSEWYWRRRLKSSCNGRDMIQICSRINEELQGLQLSCIETEQVTMACNDKLGFMKTESLAVSVGGVDCVHLLNPDISNTETVIAAGSRDQIIYLWKKRSRNSESVRSMRQYISSELTSHNGWVWCLASHKASQGVLASGSWDQDIRLWDISSGQCIRHFRKMHKGAVLGLSFPQPHLLVSAGFDKKIGLFDMRDNKSNRQDFGTHLKSVLSIESQGNYIYSSGEDKTVKLWDLRKPNEELSILKCSSSVTSICLNHDILSVAFGTSVQLIDVSQGQLLGKDIIQTDHVRPLTCVFHNLGMIITGSKDHTAHIYTMTTPHSCLKKFTHSADVTDVHYRKGIMAVGSSDRSVSLWLPNNI